MASLVIYSNGKVSAIQIRGLFGIKSLRILI